MDGSSPEHTMIARSLKDLSRFLTSSNKGSTGAPWERANKSPRMQLSFSDGGQANATHEIDSIIETEEARPIGGKRKASEQYDRTVKKHRDSVIGLDVCRLLRDKDAETADARANITKLKSDLSSLNTTHTKLKLDYDSELSRLRLAQLQDKETINELQLKLKNEKKANEGFREENHRLHDTNFKFQSSSQQRMASTTTQYAMQNEQLRTELSTLREALATTEQKLKNNVSELDVCEAEVRGLREEVSGHVRQAKELRTQLMAVDTLQLQLQKQLATNKELQGRLETVQSQEQLATSFERSVQRLPDLERQLIKLKDENDMYRACSANTRLLEEQVASATDQIALLEQRCQNATHLHAQLEHSKSQMAALEEVLLSELSLAASPQPEELRRLLKGLRSEDKSLTDSISAMRDSVASHKRQMEALEKEAKDMRDSTAQQQQLSQRHVQLARRLQRKLILVSKERDSLKTILTSYEAEATMTAALASNSGRLGALEESLGQYQLELARLEQELDYYQHAPPLHGDKVPLSLADRAQMAAQQEQVTQLQEQVSKLQEEKDVLEYRLEQRALQGDYDPSKVNVLHMKQNPTSEAEEQYRSEVSKLQEEVRRLKEQLLQQSECASKEGAVDGAAAVVVQSEEDKQKLQELEKELKSMEVKHQRFIEAYKSKSNEMRQLVYRLMGYNVLPSGDNCYKLSNMYAESPNDFFMFELASNGEIRLLLTDFSNSLEDMIDAYLNHENSYPAFLSAVTIDLFNRQTMVAAPSSTSPPSTLRAGPQGQDAGNSAVMEEEDLQQNEDDDEDEDAGEEQEDEEEGKRQGRVEGQDEVMDSDSDGENEEGQEDVAGEEEEDVEEEEDDDEDDDDDEEDDDEDDDEDERQQPQRVQHNHNAGGGGAVDDDDDDDLICLD